MKTLVVYAKSSIFKYPNLFVDFLYMLSDAKILFVYLRDPTLGEESECAAFMNWDYYIIESESE